MTKTTSRPYLALIASGLVLALQAGCTTVPQSAATPDCPPGTQELPDCPPLSAIVAPKIEEIYRNRTWVSPRQLEEDPVAYGMKVNIPRQDAYGKILGPTDEGAIDSLAVKLWLIEHAEHTIDFGYYIFTPDLVGYAMVGALCDAVKRGVDVRVMVDALGSSGLSRSTLAALKTCENQAGFMRTASGALSTRKARVQVVVFNSITNLSASPNRRSHDKMLIIDADFDDQAYIMTGGRNISLDYYGITGEGEFDPFGYRDSEILLKPDPDIDVMSIGEVSGHYFTLLFLFKGNKIINGVNADHALEIYIRERTRAREALASLKGFELLRPHLEHMDEFTTKGFRPANVLLAHNLGNLTNSRVTTRAVENLRKNPNSILYVLEKLNQYRDGSEVSRIVSPYLFLARYKDADGNVIVDEAAEAVKWLDQHPQARIEIMTNSVLTSDNFSAQSIIDMDTAPRLLLDEETRDAWRKLKATDEVGGDLTSSEAWQKQVSHPRLRIYETGRLDSSRLGGGNRNYGKLHAKFFVIKNIGFVGTSNFDYRSRLYNSEMGYFFKSDPLAADLNRAFEQLVQTAYRWGSPEWLDLRRKVREQGGIKGSSTRHQRKVFKTLKATGLHWWF